MEEDLTLPLRALSRNRHQHWSWHPPREYSHARRLRSVTITLTEAAAAASCFPLAFLSGPSGLAPCALLRRAPAGETVFVGPDGRWQAAWLPPRLAAWPFDLLSLPNGASGLALHEESAGVARGSDGLAIFNDELGRAGSESSAAPQDLAPETLHAIGPLLRQAAELSATAAACLALHRHGLLSPLDEDPELLIVDKDAAASLEDHQVQDLHRSGGLGLLYAGVVSLAHLSWMARAERHLAQPPSVCPPATSGTSGAADFLSTLSSARAEEHRIFHTPADPV